MHRGDSMYDEQSIVDLESIKCTHCSRTFAPKAYVKHCNSGEPKCLIIKKRPLFDSAKKRIVNNQHLSKDEKKRALQASKRGASKIRTSSRLKKEDRSRKWRDDSSELRSALSVFRGVAKRAKLWHANESIYNLA
jgi:hypothetical protein